VAVRRCAWGLARLRGLAVKRSCRFRVRTQVSADSRFQASSEPALWLDSCARFEPLETSTRVLSACLRPVRRRASGHTRVPAPPSRRDGTGTNANFV
jgi:hypothetical protein